MKKELIALRNQMEIRGIDVYIVPTNDFHGSEYINEFFRTRKYISGFTGSAGTLIVTKEEARLWTDGRYFLQAGYQLEGTGIDLMKEGEPGVPTVEEFLGEVLVEDNVLGFDGRVLSCNLGTKYAEIAASKGASLIYDVDLAGEIWLTRPVLKGAPIWQLPMESAGESFESKLAKVRKMMYDKGADYHLITGLEENAWLYNLRGNDVDSTPVFFSFTLIGPDFVNLYLFDGALKADLIPDGVSVRNYFAISHEISELPVTATIYIDKASASYSLVQSVPEECRIVEDISPVTKLKAVKNASEIASTLSAHEYDGVAMVKFLYWLKKEISEEKVHTEISVSDHLELLRSKIKDYLELSFATIAGYQENGAIIHYSATPETNKTLAGEGFLLVDSGGQYVSGTTDITRTIALGPLTDKMKQYYTAVLKSHLDLAMATFSKGTTGDVLDAIARKPLNDMGLDFNHGTGHGVGHVLSCHEGPQRISRRVSDVPFVPGMITSNEPGVYIEGEFGIRIENEVLCVDTEEPDTYGFRNITFCPYERDAILVDMLTEEERSYLNEYHKLVAKTLLPHLRGAERDWLIWATEEI